MAGFNGSGVYVRYYNWSNDAAANIKIRADRFDTECNGFATGLSTCITKDGQTVPTANLPMGTYKHTNVDDATLRTDYFAAGQAVDGVINWSDAGGTADAITASYPIPINTLVDGQLCYVRASAANATTTPTFSPDGITARTIVKNGGQALAAGDIYGDGHELILRYLLASTRWELMNPAKPVLSSSLTDISSKWTPASSSGAASLQFSEDTDNGTNKITLQAPATLASDYSLTLPTSSGSNGQIVQTDGSGTLSFKTQTSSIGFARNMIIKRASTTTIDVDYDEVVTKTALGGIPFIHASGDFTINLATTGALGLDTGSLANNTFYGIYAAYNPTTSAATVFACTLAASSATIYAGANAPSGYTATALIGWFLTDGSAQVSTFYQFERKTWFPKANVLNVTTSATTYTSVSLSAVVPTIAKTVGGILGATAVGGFTGAIAGDTSGTGQLLHVVLPSSSSGTALDSVGFGAPFDGLPIITAQTLYYKTQTTTDDVRIDICTCTF